MTILAISTETLASAVTPADHSVGFYGSATGPSSFARRVRIFGSSSVLDWHGPLRVFWLSEKRSPRAAPVTRQNHESSRGTSLGPRLRRQTAYGGPANLDPLSRRV